MARASPIAEQQAEAGVSRVPEENEPVRGPSSDNRGIATCFGFLGSDHIILHFIAQIPLETNYGPRNRVYHSLRRWWLTLRSPFLGVFLPLHFESSFCPYLPWSSQASRSSPNSPRFSSNLPGRVSPFSAGRFISASPPCSAFSSDWYC